MTSGVEVYTQDVKDSSGNLLKAAGTRETVSSLAYDGYGNRVSDTHAGGATSTYTYNAANQLLSSSVGETWTYDAVGNTVESLTQNDDGKWTRSETTYNAERRATVTRNTSKKDLADGGHTTTITNTYAAVGNITRARTDAATENGNYGYLELTERDMRYNETKKYIDPNTSTSSIKGIQRYEGTSLFQYDVNGQLIQLDRGYSDSDKKQSLSTFAYDADGQIVSRTDVDGGTGSLSFIEGYADHPDTLQVETSIDNGDGWSSLSISQTASNLNKLFNGQARGTTTQQQFLYANNHPMAQARVSSTVELKTLSLSGVDANGQYTLTSSVIVTNADGSVNRSATAKKIAQAYSGATLSEAALNKLAAYIESKLPATLTAGQTVALPKYVQLTDSVGNTLSATIVDGMLRHLGDGQPAGSVSAHQARAGETLQSIAAQYYGSSSYWYLIAEANGLQGSEALVEGTTLNIPNKVASGANSQDSYKVYNESEIIGSTSPELRTVKKKKKWYQKLVMVLVVVIMIVAAVMTAGAAAAIMAAGYSTVAGLALSAVAGAVIYAGANIISQGLMMAADLQDGFSWKQVGKAAVTGAISGMAAYALAGIDAAGTTDTSGMSADQIKQLESIKNVGWVKDLSNAGSGMQTLPSSTPTAVSA